MHGQERELAEIFHSAHTSMSEMSGAHVSFNDANETREDGIPNTASWAEFQLKMLDSDYGRSTGTR